MHLCAGSNGKIPCNSERGGPLIVQENGHYTVVGVSSGDYGACSGRPGYPEVFARVTASLTASFFLGQGVVHRVANGWGPRL